MPRVLDRHAAMSCRDAFLGLALLIVHTGCVAPGDVATLALPRSRDIGESVFLEVRVGRLGSGQEIELSTDAGRPLGVISPYGIGPGREAGTYVVPLPAHAVRDGRVRVRLRVIRAGAAPRRADASEVRNLRIVMGR